MVLTEDTATILRGVLEGDPDEISCLPGEGFVVTLLKQGGYLNEDLTLTPEGEEAVRHICPYCYALPGLDGSRVHASDCDMEPTPLSPHKLWVTLMVNSKQEVVSTLSGHKKSPSDFMGTNGENALEAWTSDKGWALREGYSLSYVPIVPPSRKAFQDALNQDVQNKPNKKLALEDLQGSELYQKKDS